MLNCGQEHAGRLIYMHGTEFRAGDASKKLVPRVSAMPALTGVAHPSVPHLPFPLLWSWQVEQSSQVERGINRTRQLGEALIKRKDRAAELGNLQRLSRGNTASNALSGRGSERLSEDQPEKEGFAYRREQGKELSISRKKGLSSTWQHRAVGNV